jgi:hypothetical protein
LHTSLLRKLIAVCVCMDDTGIGRCGRYIGTKEGEKEEREKQVRVEFRMRRVSGSGRFSKLVGD